jgi:hypothetical protein
MDVNGNGGEEWVVWDINARRILVFESDGEKFTYLPEMAFFFPADVNGFLILADFNLDGKKDLFTSSPFGIKVYKNTSASGSPFPQWEVAQIFLRLDTGSNLQANNLDIPMVMDIDGDGDLDIASFNISDNLDLYLNTSVERKGVADIDGFAFPDPWWGRFEFCGCGEFCFGITCEGLPMGRIVETDEGARLKHTGGHSVLYSDLYGDDVNDLLLGRDECNTLYFMANRGTDIQPIFDSFSNELPGYGTLPEFPIFHASYLWEDKLIVSRARKIERFFSQPFYVAERFTGIPGRYVPLADIVTETIGEVDGLVPVSYNEAREIALALTALLLVSLTWNAPNQIGATVFVLMFVMRLISKINLFIGVPNSTSEMLPEHLAYLKSYFGRNRMTVLLVVSIVAIVGATFGFATLALAAPTGSAAMVGASLLTTLSLLGVLEHLFLALPFRDGMLWGWAIKKRTGPTHAGSQGNTNV